jgi:exopolyphosphatase/guanosine-5'-triphosphate,3'-diphosphate pyrophosphatase
MRSGSGSVAHRELRASDLALVREQLGREPTTAFAVVARCTGGHPLVIRNAPVDANGDPFPTTFWLTCPEAVKAVARIESEGWIARLNERVQDDEAFDEALEAAHRAYAEERGSDLPEARAWGGVAGTRTGVKCLHAHYAYHLAGGDDPVGAWTAERVEPVHATQRPGRVGAIDQGTNSIRLLVVEPGAGAGAQTELARDMVITRLGEGVDRTGRLDPEALARTIEMLEWFCRQARHLGAERIRVAATSAVRDAENREEFADAVRRLAGSELEVISGEREAGLSFLGGTHGLDPNDAPAPYLLFDIGGGSTEFVAGDTPGNVASAISTRMGSVRLTERLVAHDPPTPEDLAALETEVGARLDEAEAAVPGAREARTLVAVAGTATTLQAIALGLDRYDPEAIHRSWLSLADAERILLDLARMTNAERAALPVMAPGRGDVMVAGAVIFVETLRRFGFDRALVSETDILDGLAFELLGIG